MTFVASHYAWLLFVLPAIALLKIWADARAQRTMESFAASERIRKNLLGGASPIWSGLHFGLQLLGLAFFIIALTRPQFGLIEKEISESGRNIFIAIDTSKSMLAQDVKPDRLTRAKLAAQDLLDKLEGDRVGLIAFAGRSFLQAPLTTDHDAVTEAIQALDHSTIPRGGSSLASAIELAVKTAKDSNTKRNGLIIFTDGQETDDATISAAESAKASGLLILPVGVGTTEGDVIPDPEPDMRNNSGYVTDASGNIVHSRLESGMLREVAQITGGEYAELASQALTRSLISKVTAKLDAHEAQSSPETHQAERYQFPLLVGLLFMALSLFMRPSSRKRVKVAPVLPVDPQASVHHVPLPATSKTVAVLLIFALLGGSVSTASAAVSLTPKQQLERANREYDKGNYKEARSLYSNLLGDDEHNLPQDQLAYGVGATNMKLGDQDQAINAFSRSLRSHNEQLQLKSLRALGYTLYKKGEKMVEKEPKRALKVWEDSLSHLGTALQRNSSDEHTLENYDFVREQIDKLKKQIEQAQQQQQQQGQNGQQGNQPQPGQGGGDGQPQPRDGENEGDQNKSGQDAMQEEGQAVPEGEISAGEGGEPADDQKQGNANAQAEDETRRNDATGFTPQEARSQLRSYAGDQNSVQYLMRREPPQGGKDY